MSETAAIPIGIVFLAGVVSFLSPCVLPIVPSYVGFVTGLTLDDLRVSGTPAARRRTALYAGLFVLGFSALFVALGATATVLGGAVRRALPMMQQVGGVAIVLFGLYLLGAVRLSGLDRERRFLSARKPAGAAGALIAGVAFGAGWTPCIGPVLASVLLYASFEATMTRGMLLLGVYALGLGIPFFAAAVALNWFLVGRAQVRRWVVPLQRTAGALLVVIGVLLVTGELARMSGFLAQFTPLIEVGW